MKSLLKGISFAAIALLFAAAGSNAQDVVKTNPKNTKLLADTAGTRMILVTLAPGEELIKHTHPTQMLYCLKAGQLTVNYESGKTEKWDLKAGDAMSAPSDPPHTTKNTGKTTLSFLEIEITGHLHH